MFWKQKKEVDMPPAMYRAAIVALIQALKWVMAQDTRERRIQYLQLCEALSLTMHVCSREQDDPTWSLQQASLEFYWRIRQQELTWEERIEACRDWLGMLGVPYEER